MAVSRFGCSQRSTFASLKPVVQRCRVFIDNWTSKRLPRTSTTVINALPPTYGYVLGSVALSAVVVQWMAIKVGFARRQYRVSLPKMYAEGDDEAAAKFNCTQRAHQNTVENLPVALGLQIALAPTYPITAAALGATWAIGRILYMQGYSTGDPNKRAPGFALSTLGQWGLIGTALVAAVKLQL